MIDECVSACGNTACRYNQASIKTPGVKRLVYMRDNPKMGCEGWKPIKAASKPERAAGTAKAKKSARKPAKKPAKRTSTKRPAKKEKAKT